MKMISMHPFLFFVNQKIRLILQWVFCLIVLFIGFRFYQFATILETGIIPRFERPPGVEAFLPISALVSLKHTILTGTVNTIHPSGLIIFLVICVTAFIAKKGFCSWICPFGLFSEYLNKLKKISFISPIVMPGWIDKLLQSLKYLLLAFFAGSIFFKMPLKSIEQFIHSPYNRFADIKMLKFFTDISATAFLVILSLTILSLVFSFFWCRYLCPYGALLGIIGFFSIGKIRRNAENCTGCGICEQHCMGKIKIRQYQSVTSVECTACMACVEHCPEKKAIGFSLLLGKLPVSRSVLACIFIIVFISGIRMAKINGFWQNSIRNSDYLNYVTQNQNSLSFPMSHRISPEKMERMRQMMIQMQQSGSMRDLPMINE